MSWNPGSAKRSTVERKVGNYWSVGFSSGFNPSCQACSADDSQGWDTFGNKTWTPKGPQRVSEALWVLAFRSDVLCWHRIPALLCLRHPGNANHYFYSSHAGVSPCWDALGCSLESSFPLTSCNFSWTDPGNVFQWCRAKGYRWKWWRPHHINFSESFQWNLIKHSDWAVWISLCLPHLSYGWLRLGYRGEFIACDICWDGCGFTHYGHFDLFPHCLQVSVGFSWISYAIDLSPWSLREHIDDRANLSDKEMSCMLMHFPCPLDSISVLVRDRALASH